MDITVKRLINLISLKSVVVFLYASLYIRCVLLAVIRDDDPKPWFDRGHHDRYTWMREIGDDNVVIETAYAPKGYKFIVMKSRDKDLLHWGYRRCTSYYDFTGPEPIVVITVKGHKNNHPCLVANIDLNYRAIKEDLDIRNSSTSATSLVPQVTWDGTISPLDEQAEQRVYRTNPGIRAACHGRRLVDMRTGGTGTATSDNSKVIKLLLLDRVVNVIEFKIPSQKSSSWRTKGSLLDL